MQNRIVNDLVAAAQQQDYEMEADNNPQDFSEVARKHFERSRHAVEHYVASHPEICLAAATVLGVALGWWIKRK